MSINTIVITVLNCIVCLLYYHSPQDPIFRGSTAQRTGDRIVRALWPTSSDVALVASYLGAQCKETSTKLVKAVWDQSQMYFLLLYGFECSSWVLVLCLFSAQQFSLCSQSNKIHFTDTTRSHYSRFWPPSVCVTCQCIWMAQYWTWHKATDSKTADAHSSEGL